MREGFIRKESQRKWKRESRKAGAGKSSKFKVEESKKRKTITGRRRERREKRDKRWSEEKIKDEKKEAQEEKNGGTINAAARESRDGAHERNRYGFKTGLSADSVERASWRVAGEVAAEKGKLIVEPHGEIAAAPPHERATSHKQKIAETGQGPDRRARSPIHKSSHAAHAIC